MTIDQRQIYTWRRLNISDADSVEALHRRALRALPDPTLVKPEKPGFFTDLLSGRGFGIGAFVDGELVAFGTTINEVKAGDSLKAAIGLPEDVKVAKLHGSAVHEAHRRLGLHKLLIAARMQMLRPLALDAVYSTAHPMNFASLRNLFRADFVARGVAEQYGGLMRVLLRWEQKHEPTDMFEHETAFVPSADTDLLRQLLEQGWTGHNVTRDAQGRSQMVVRRLIA